MPNHEVVVGQEIVGFVYDTENGGKKTVALKYLETVERPGVDFIDQSGIKGKLRLRRERILFED